MRKSSSKKKNKKDRSYLTIIVLLFLVLTISIGYAALSSNLNINGTTKIKGQKFDVHFDSISNVTKIGSASDTGTNEFTPKIVEKESTPSDKTDDHTVNFSVSLHLPGDKYQFQVKVVNEGTTDANARLTVSPIPSNASQYIHWDVTGIDTVNGERIAVGEYKMVTVSIEYDSAVTDLPEEDITVNLSAVVSAEQTW